MTLLIGLWVKNIGHSLGRKSGLMRENNSKSLKSDWSKDRKAGR